MTRSDFFRGCEKMKQIKVLGSLLIAIVLSLINFDQLFILIVLSGVYALFKAMDLYYEYSN
ncbi:hypothetical protein GCM10011573_33970 [Enterococcus wangshanyuanii]|uniref:Uncharacterized protein n=1 Tax=Enterococcus wangshanyuanii TaxID=2005703 RepID=A0ABQ1PR33_9ENTE|nr:hypothetical protein GCM10011573_33970 [Enterococcus wangshanyuanii]